jgi:hypothetical protein
VSSTGNAIINAYIAAIVAVSVLYPLILLHGYRTWWVALFYAVLIGASIGGTISHHRMVRRNVKS